MFISTEDSRYRYAVQISTYQDPRIRDISQHYSLAAAIRSARSIIGGRKYRLRNLKTCKIWDKENNAQYPVARAETILKESAQ